MIKKLVVSASVVAAAFAVAGFAERGLYLASAGCIGWMMFVIIANIKRPRVGAQGKVQNQRCETKILHFYDIKAEHDFQERIRILHAREEASR